MVTEWDLASCLVCSKHPSTDQPFRIFLSTMCYFFLSSVVVFNEKISLSVAKKNWGSESFVIVGLLLPQQRGVIHLKYSNSFFSLNLFLDEELNDENVCAFSEREQRVLKHLLKINLRLALRILLSIWSIKLKEFISESQTKIVLPSSW